MAQKIAIVSPELPPHVHISSSHAINNMPVLWFAEIEGLCAYLLHNSLDQILIDEKLLIENHYCTLKYQQIISQMHPNLSITSTKIISHQQKYFYDHITYFPVLEDLFKNSEPYSVFQPIVNTSNKKETIMGFECLSRIGFDNKLFAPEFLLVDYDKRCLSQALLLAPRISHVLIFVNIRPQTLVSSNFLPWFKDLLQEKKLNPENIIIEVTEHNCIITEAHITAQCEQLRELGLRIALDDFGCGISNHSMIVAMKPDFIKIPGKFIKNSHDSSIKQKIIKNILDLSSDCGINAIVESVESTQDWALATSLGACLAQGFYFFKPMPHHEINALLAKA